MRTAIFPKDRHALYEQHGYSAAIQSKDLLFVSGQVGSLEDGSPVPDFENRVIQAFKNLAETLKAAGCTFDDIIDVTPFIPIQNGSLKAFNRKISLFVSGQVGVTW